MTVRLVLFLCLISGIARADAVAKASDRPSRQWSDLSDKDKVKLSSDAVSQMRKLLKEMFQKLEEARDSKDIDKLEKLNCVNADVATSKALVDFAERADLQLQELLARGEKKQDADNELNKTMIALGKVKTLRAESDDCLGGFRFQTDELTTVDVVVQPGIPAGDPTNPARPGPVVSRPPAASPY